MSSAALLIVWIVLAANVAGAVMMWIDKRAAEADRWRIPERTLLGAAALGAGPLMLFLSNTLRHKTRKQPFRMRLIAIAVIEIALFFLVLYAWVTS